jgi:YD repeat-containing protein
VITQAFVESQTGHNTAGSTTFARDPLQHQTSLSYADSFSDYVNRNTFAYPTTVTDADGYSSTTQYHYDMGVLTRAQDPKGAVRTTSYDAAGRVSRIDISNGAYTRYVYPTAQTQVDTYTLIQTGGGELYSTSVLDGAGRVRATASSFPGSTGGYRGQLIVYDVMGRAVQQSNPTEITSAWVPVGDDAAAGWLYSSQSYDWKGRTRVSTNTDQTTRETTYGGCGCAGGEVMTIRDEMNRRQRMTYDVLGRLVKAESLNFDQSVYATRTDTYNARDQITRIFVQQGTSGTGQETLMTFDGHGRLQTRKAPIEESATVYAYCADDTVQKVTDPRGASSTYTYNGRHLVGTITYAKPGGSAAQGPDESNAIPLVPPGGFDYDEAGNRLSMTDGLGRVDYVYDTWSRLTSETRLFNDFPGSPYPLTYDYNLAGQLKMVTDPFGKAINYAYDQAGQLTGVTGSNFGGVTQYASNIQYRAWGALKHMASGNGSNVNNGYDGRLRITSFGNTTYDYYGDGRVQFVHFPGNPSFDRKYSYDHVGRLSEGLSGTDARGEPYDSNNPNPYKQTYSYDVWGNMTGRSNRWWTLDQGAFTVTYTNDRNTDGNIPWQYDAAGNIKHNGAGNYTYDTAGRMKQFDSVNTIFITQLYDGDGLPGYRLETHPGLTDRATIYYVRSSVLGGQAITELKANGGKRRTYVYLNGAEIARQEKMSTDHVTWIGRDPITGDDDITRDPLGGYIGGEFDVLVPDYAKLKGDAPTHDREADPFDSGSGCTIDGIVIDCSTFASMVNNGAVSVASAFGGKVFGDVSHLGFGGAWVRQWTPSQRTSDPDNPNLNVTDNAYLDVWVPFSGLGYVRVLGVRHENQNIQTALDRVRFSVQWSVPKDQQAPTGAIRECGKFRVKITLSNLQGGLENSAFVTRIEPSNDDAGGFRILGDLGVERKGDKATFTGTVQVGNIVSLNLNGASFIGMRVFIQVPDTSSTDPDEVRLRGLEVQKYKRDSAYDSFAVRDTILGASRTDPFKHCDSVPLKK